MNEQRGILTVVLETVVHIVRASRVLTVQAHCLRRVLHQYGLATSVGRLVV
jgi:hypothetical protein